MSVIAGSLIPEGTRVRVRRGAMPLSPDLIGCSGTVVDASEYRPHSYGVALDGDREVRRFAPDELEVSRALPLPPERQAAKARLPLP